jgi:hypothetical protein
MRAKLVTVVLAALAVPARGDGSPVDPKGPAETDKLVGTVLVWNDAAFYLDANDKSMQVQLATLEGGARKQDVGAVVPMKVLSTAGDFVEVAPTAGTDCTWTKLPQPEDLAKLSLFVKRSDLAPLVIKPFAKTWKNGTSLVARVGLPVVPTTNGAYRVAVDQAHLTAEIPAASIGYAYTAAPRKRPGRPGAKYLVEDKASATLGGETFEMTALVAVPAVIKRKDSVLVRLQTTCLDATISVPPITVREGGMGMGYGIGGGRPGATRGERWVLPKGTPLYTALKRQVAVTAAAEIDVGKPDGKSEVCFTRTIRLDHPYPEAPSSKSTKTKLLLCTPSTNVKHINEVPPRY